MINVEGWINGIFSETLKKINFILNEEAIGFDFPQNIPNDFHNNFLVTVSKKPDPRPY